MNNYKIQVLLGHIILKFYKNFVQFNEKCN